MGELKSFLSIEVSRDQAKQTIMLSQSGYISAVLEWFGFAEAKLVQTLMVMQVMEGLTRKGNTNEFNSQEEEYSSIVRSLMYLMTMMRPDLASSVGIISRYLSNPSVEHLMTVKYILHYVKGMKDYGLTLGSPDKDLNLCGYADANWGNDVDMQKSTSGFTFLTGRGAISWCSKRQSTIALLTMKAEYITLCASVQEAV